MLEWEGLGYLQRFLRACSIEPGACDGVPSPRCLTGDLIVISRKDWEGDSQCVLVSRVLS